MSLNVSGSAERAIVFWIPDWPIHAHLGDRAERSAPVEQRHDPTAAPLQPADVTHGLTPPLALIAAHCVVACSEQARADGVRVGLREREAQARCPGLEVYPHDAAIDTRRFMPVLAAIEQIVPGVEERRPGLCAMRARGPARYYGGEVPAASAVLALAASLGFTDARIGIADGLFAAEQAARAGATDHGLTAPGPNIRIVPPGASQPFLAPLPIARATDSALADVLTGLGIRTLGALAALPEEAVRERFGPNGLAAHRRAAARGPQHGAEVRPRSPVRELAVETEFETPISASEQLAFACMTLAERFVRGLAEERLVCTGLRVELTDDIGVRHEREWLHPRRFTAADTVGRIRWQADALPASAQGAPNTQSAPNALQPGSAAPGSLAPRDGLDADHAGAGVVRVRITPTHTDRAAHHEPGLWSSEPDTRVHHQLSRAQSRLGHAEVGTMALAGGRLLADRQRFLPWSTARSRVTEPRGSHAGPWPGALPGPTPGRVFPAPIPAELRDAEGAPIGIDDDDLLTGDPEHLSVGRTAFTEPVEGWSAPWAVRERWWQGTSPRFRLQLQLADGDAWLLIHTHERWFAEGRYD